MLLLIIMPTKAAYASKTIAVSANGEYQIVQLGEWGDKLLIVHNGKTIHEITPQYSEELYDSIVDVGYSSLAWRGSLAKQPQAFDDITGDGKPNIFCIERSRRGGNHPPWNVAIRIFSISGDKIEEFTILDSIGEGLHFDDFNNDGIFELVNTDHERYFLYSREGMPISQYVWIFDPGYKLYYQATKMIEE